MKILVYHHDDADGKLSAKIVQYFYPRSEVIFREVNYNEENINYEEVENADVVYMVDFTSDNMIEFAKKTGTKLVWIDHHKTAKERFADLWNSPIKGLRSLDKAGCALTWECFSDRQAPNIVDYIADRDMWKFEWGNTKPFYEGFNLLITDMDDDLWVELLVGDQCAEGECIGLGEVLLKRQLKRTEQLFENGIDVSFHGYRARQCNTTSYFSELGEYIYSKPEYDIAVMWQVVKDRIVFSLRSNTVDCAKIAQEHGGGGHLGAAGFSIENVSGFPYRSRLS